jgi:hypothetical protein
MSFFSRDNLLMVIDVFLEYLENTYSIKLETLENVDVIRKNMFAIMTEVNNETQGSNLSLEQRNIALLAKAKKYYMEKLNLPGKPASQNISRDKEVFGHRQVIMNENRPEIDPYSKRATVDERMMIDRIRETRDEELGLRKPVPDHRVIAPLENDQPVSKEDFEKKLQRMETDRKSTNVYQQTMRVGAAASRMEVGGEVSAGASRLEVGGVASSRLEVEMERNVANAIEYQDPKRLYMNNRAALTDTIYANDVIRDRQEIIIPRTGKQRLLTRYLSLNSFDRSWVANPQRYRYTVNFQNKDNDIMNKYRNITSISVSKIVIPEEVIPSNSVINQQKTAFNYEFSFSYPYVLLSIDEFPNVYDGTNQHVRNAFATMIYHRHYKAPNGRGYVILKPIQNEVKEFYPNLLGTLPKITINITKPNGELFNQSSDEYKIFKIDYEAFNPHYLKIVTNVYFDKNEFYIGDVCTFSGYQAALSPETQSLRELNMFINRSEGHEIKQIGQANDNGFYKTFYIEAPGVFDKVLGRFNVNQGCIGALNAFNATIDYCVHQASNGSIMNNSLQNTVTMKLDMLVEDANTTIPIVEQVV